jgi:hypothetical protein
MVMILPDAAHVVMMPVLRLADGGVKAWQLHAILA